MNRKQQNIIFHVSEITNLIGEPICSTSKDLVAWTINGDMGESVQITLIAHEKGCALLLSDSVPNPLYYTLKGYAHTHGIMENEETHDLDTVGDVVDFYRKAQEA